MQAQAATQFKISSWHRCIYSPHVIARRRDASRGARGLSSTSFGCKMNAAEEQELVMIRLMIRFSSCRRAEQRGVTFLSGRIWTYVLPEDMDVCLTFLSGRIWTYVLPPFQPLSAVVTIRCRSCVSASRNTPRISQSILRLLLIQHSHTFPPSLPPSLGVRECMQESGKQAFRALPLTLRGGETNRSCRQEVRPGGRRLRRCQDPSTFRVTRFRP
jgi:hypothetical protein